MKATHDSAAETAAELARLLPELAERDLPASRQPILREHMMSEIRLPGGRRAAPDLPPARRRAAPARRPWLITAAAATGAGALAAGLILGLQSPVGHAARPGAASHRAAGRSAGITAVQLLADVAHAAARQAPPAVRSSQYWYIETDVAFGSEVRAGHHGIRFVPPPRKPYPLQVWESVSDVCLPVLIRMPNGAPALPRSGGSRAVSFTVGAPGKGGPRHAIASASAPGDGFGQGLEAGVGRIGVGPGGNCQGTLANPTYQLLQSLPASPGRLLAMIYAGRPRTSRDAARRAFATIGTLLAGDIAPPRISAALLRAAALIPGVRVVADATDALGRHGVAVALTAGGFRSEWIFSRRTLQMIGQRDVSVGTGSVTGSSAILARAVVDRPGQLPRGH